MSVLRGTVTGSITGVPYNIASTLVSYYLTNMTAGSITVTVAVDDNITGNSVALFNMDIPANESRSSEVEVIIPSKSTIYISTSGELDYFFSFK